MSKSVSAIDSFILILSECVSSRVFTPYLLGVEICLRDNGDPFIFSPRTAVEKVLNNNRVAAGPYSMTDVSPIAGLSPEDEVQIILATNASQGHDPNLRRELLIACMLPLLVEVTD